MLHTTWQMGGFALHDMPITLRRSFRYTHLVKPTVERLWILRVYFYEATWREQNPSAVQTYAPAHLIPGGEVDGIGQIVHRFTCRRRGFIIPRYWEISRCMCLGHNNDNVPIPKHFPRHPFGKSMHEIRNIIRATGNEEIGTPPGPLADVLHRLHEQTYIQLRAVNNGICFRICYKINHAHHSVGYLVLDQTTNFAGLRKQHSLPPASPRIICLMLFTGDCPSEYPNLERMPVTESIARH